MNKIISFNGIKIVKRNQRQDNEYFSKLISEIPETEWNTRKGYTEESESKVSVPLKPSIGTDLTLKPKTASLPKPFALSDKRLILDEYQEAAIEHFRNGENVMVTAPTGTGKTLIAEHAINDVLNSGKKVIYTTPLKALCNDKYKQFCKLWGDYDENGKLIGSSKVGLATGDVKINTNAPLVIMTTEIYRNMLTQHGEKDLEKQMKDVSAVIFDEFHYMGNSQRGSVWEEAIMFSPPRIRHLMLSATIANANPINNWLNAINDHHKSVVVNVPEDERHVPLKYLAYTSTGGKTKLQNLLDETIRLKELEKRDFNSKEKEALSEIGRLFHNDDGIEALRTTFNDVFCDFDKKAKPERFMQKLIHAGLPLRKAEQYALRMTDKKSRNINKELAKIDPMYHISLPTLIRDLEQKQMTPALYFVYSKRNCKGYMKEASEKMGQLLNNHEKFEVAKRIDELDKKGIFLGTDFEEDIKPCLLNGFAMHHSGMLPQCKSFIEQLGRDKLIKVCFATDTLGAGINFPFKTVVFSDFEKYTDDGLEEISVNSFKQGAGRAGRRGIDDIGYVVTIPKNKDEVSVPFEKIVQEPEEIQSAFKLSYGLVLSPRFLNQPMRILEKSFDNYQRKNFDVYLEKSHTMKGILKRHKFVEGRKGEILKLTPKGKIASKIRGINEILITELLTDREVMGNISPAELAGIISIFAPEKEEFFEKDGQYGSNEYSKKVNKAISLALSIKDEETENGLDSDIKINTDFLPYIKLWAEIPGGNNNKVLWTSIIKKMMANKTITSDGDFFKKINYTTNVLKQIQKVAPTGYLRDTASQAVKMLQKSPVNDILLYELDYKGEDEQIKKENIT